MEPESFYNYGNTNKAVYLLSNEEDKFTISSYKFTN